MVVFLREPGTSVFVGSANESVLVTVLKLLPEKRAIRVLVNGASVHIPGQLDIRMIELALGESVKIGQDVEMTLVDLRDDKARLGINAPRESSVHRLEVYQAIRREHREDDPEEGTGGSRVPRPPSPSPPTLDVRLTEPPSADLSGK